MLDDIVILFIVWLICMILLFILGYCYIEILLSGMEVKRGKENMEKSNVERK